MTICEQIDAYLGSISPRKATNGQIRAALNLMSQEKVCESTQSLLRGGKIKGLNTGSTWKYWKPAKPFYVVPRQM